MKEKNAYEQEYGFYTCKFWLPIHVKKTTIVFTFIKNIHVKPFSYLLRPISLFVYQLSSPFLIDLEQQHVSKSTQFLFSLFRLILVYLNQHDKTMLLLFTMPSVQGHTNQTTKIKNIYRMTHNNTLLFVTHTRTFTK